MWAWLRACWLRASFLVTRRRLDDETRQEIEAHLALLTERYRQQGFTADAAYVAARRQFGNVTRLREDLHGMNGIRWIESLLQDASYGLRQLRTRLGFTGVVAATHGLGIGGATAVFSVVQVVLLAPLPYDDPDSLVRFYQQEPGSRRRSTS